VLFQGLHTAAKRRQKPLSGTRDTLHGKQLTGQCEALSGNALKQSPLLLV
jgi:hypothetical protein